MTWTQAAQAIGISRTCLESIIAGRSAPHLQAKLGPRIAAARVELRRRKKTRPSEKACTRCAAILPNTEKFFPPFTKRGKRVLAGRCRSCKKKENKQRYIDSKLRVLRHYSGGDPRCACCEEASYEFMTIDHINGGGRAHRAEIRKGKGGVSSIHLWLEANEFPEGFRVLCLNCNGAIGFFGYCPHQGRPDDSLIPA
jgi:hypothetical protein